jgi:hypothetical protein
MAFSQVMPLLDPKNSRLGRANAAGTGTTNRIPSTAATLRDHPSWREASLAHLDGDGHEAHE